MSILFSASYDYFQRVSFKDFFFNSWIEMNEEF